jgi:hypothetical protein
MLDDHIIIIIGSCTSSNEGRLTPRHLEDDCLKVVVESNQTRPHWNRIKSCCYSLTYLTTLTNPNRLSRRQSESRYVYNCLVCKNPVSGPISTSQSDRVYLGLFQKPAFMRGIRSVVLCVARTTFRFRSPFLDKTCTSDAKRCLMKSPFSAHSLSTRNF